MIPLADHDGAGGRWHWREDPAEGSSAAWTGVGPLRHQPALDGLRAVAVTAVLLFHARFGWATGGFLGVSLFFTLSGFLITSLLLREGTRTERIDLRRFWTRRFRRLLPASWATIGLVVAMGLAGVWSAAQLRDLRGDVLSALAQVVNWHFILQGRSYGATFQSPSPLEHFWSLAIEEQFYLLLPLVVVGLLAFERRRGGRDLRILVAVFSAAAVGSAVLNGVLAGSGTDAAYFGTFSRMFELLAGALVACALLRSVRLRSRAVRIASEVGALVGFAVALVLWHVATVGSRWMYPGGFLLFAACSCALILAAMQDGVVARVLSWRPLVALGGISYGVYLLHWPVFLWLSPERVGWAPWPLFALQMAVTLALAVVMFRFLERPVRVGGLLPAKRVRTVVPAALIVLVVSTAVVTADLPAPTSLERAAASDTTVAPRALRVMAVGDELAASVQGVADPGGRTPLDLSVLASPGCGLAVGGWVRRSDGAVERDVDRCGEVRSSRLAAVQQARPDVVVLWAGLRDVADRRLATTSPWAAPGSADLDSFLRGDVVDLITKLSSEGTRVAVLSTPPVRNGAPAPAPVPTTLPSDPVQADLAAADAAGAAAGVPPAGWAENDDSRIAAWNAILSTAASTAGATYIDVAGAMSTWPGGALDPAWRSSGVGLSPRGATKLTRWLAPKLWDLTANAATPAPRPPMSGATIPPAPAPAPAPRRVVPADRPAHVAVVGDSVGYNVGFGLTAWGKGRPDVAVANAAVFGCPITRGGSYRYLRDIATFADCDWTTRFSTLIRDQRPDVVVLVTGIWEVVDRRFPDSDRWTQIGDPDVDARILSEVVSAIDLLGSGGANVVVLTYPHFQAGLNRSFTDLPESEPGRVDRLNKLLRTAAAQRPGVARIVDFQAWYAQQPGGEEDAARRPDGVHFADSYAPVIGAWLGPQLVQIARTP